jgi:hypothetical protein
VEVQPYAFTTKSLYVGHTDYKYLRWQVGFPIQSSDYFVFSRAVDPDSLDPAFQVNPDTDPDPDTGPNPIRIQGFDDKNLR